MLAWCSQRAAPGLRKLAFGFALTAIAVTVGLLVTADDAQATHGFSSSMELRATSISADEVLIELGGYLSFDSVSAPGYALSGCNGVLPGERIVMKPEAMTRTG